MADKRADQPVSYTHLDVYKRQNISWIVRIRVALLSLRFASTILILSKRYLLEEPRVSLKLLDDCLLYTSRCV